MLFWRRLCYGRSNTGITETPVNLSLILERYSNEIRSVMYSGFMRASVRSIGDVISFFNSDMGACAFEPLTNRFIIYYNDDLSAHWIRFTLAHELGHIFLEHHQKAGTDILGHTFIPKEDYEEYEKEANVFARNLLSPRSSHERDHLRRRLCGTLSSSNRLLDHRKRRRNAPPFSETWPAGFHQLFVEIRLMVSANFLELLPVFINILWIYISEHICLFFFSLTKVLLLIPVSWHPVYMNLFPKASSHYRANPRYHFICYY